MIFWMNHSYQVTFFYTNEKRYFPTNHSYQVYNAFEVLVYLRRTMPLLPSPSGRRHLWVYVVPCFTCAWKWLVLNRSYFSRRRTTKKQIVWTARMLVDFYFWSIKCSSSCIKLIWFAQGVSEKKNCSSWCPPLRFGWMVVRKLISSESQRFLQELGDPGWAGREELARALEWGRTDGVPSFFFFNGWVFWGGRRWGKMEMGDVLQFKNWHSKVFLQVVTSFCLLSNHQNGTHFIWCARHAWKIMKKWQTPQHICLATTWAKATKPSHNIMIYHFKSECRHQKHHYKRQKHVFIYRNHQHPFYIISITNGNVLRNKHWKKEEQPAYKIKNPKRSIIKINIINRATKHIQQSRSYLAQLAYEETRKDQRQQDVLAVDTLLWLVWSPEQQIHQAFSGCLRSINDMLVVWGTVEEVFVSQVTASRPWIGCDGLERLGVFLRGWGKSFGCGGPPWDHGHGMVLKRFNGKTYSIFDDFCVV